MGDWISIKDRLPEPGVRILARDAVAEFTGSCHFWTDENHTEFFFDSGVTHTLNEVTHWMPLPDPPG